MLTIPNAISVTRLALVPLFLWLLFGRDDTAAAAWVLFVIGSTDWVDGFVARRLDQVSEVGKILDPVADRVAVAVAVVAGLTADVLPEWLAVPLLIREGFVGFASVFLVLRRVGPVDVRYLGKVATGLVYSGVVWMFFAVGYDWNWLEVAASVAGGVGLVLYYLVLIPYAGDVRARLAQPGAGGA
jgi:cardiolipin synthase